MSRSGHPAAADTVEDSAAIVVRTVNMAPRSFFPVHTHDEHQLAWARSGVLVVTTRGGEWILPPSRALWIPAGAPHQTAASGSATTLRSLYLEPRRAMPDWPDPQPVAVSPLVAALIDHLADAVLDPPRRARAQAVLIDTLEPVPATTITVPMPKDSRALAVARALVADPSDPRNLDQWGRHVGASARTLARAFVADTGIPFARWRTAVRLRAALTRLSEGEPVVTVARRVGYATPSAFVAAFVRETGITPGSYFRSGPGPGGRGDVTRRERPGPAAAGERGRRSPRTR
ncbi:AraC family transcriptional regulator [Streptantibioticus rubrisoli]|uniref:Helix-turn-helix transcriptional regulator n=1 Tax=Streptantibioticus rubrisoli TaxID=1387313 RepID=A0ABT1P6M8_9ACTN|nr:helix-turn-helix transcriptional regulator [Streptantibioticus rubrisoli]MCQ4041024.1 helix-turn-helix transcriptional regulator [Streptantibioticus rubrisoli]